MHRPLFGPATPHVYLIDLATAQLLAESSHLSLYIQDGNVSTNYQLFEDGRNALKEFVRLAKAGF